MGSNHVLPAPVYESSYRRRSTPITLPSAVTGVFCYRKMACGRLSSTRSANRRLSRGTA